MTPRIHGGDLHQIKKLYPDATLPWIDLSTGISPFSYPWIEKIPSEILNGASNRLPGEADYDICRDAYARYLGCKKDHILFGAGSQALLEKMPMLFSTTDVFILGPTYKEHERSWDRMGHNIHYLPYSAESFALIPEGKIVIITSPNNPDGQVIDRDILYHFACDYCQGKGSVIIDEAFMDLMPEESLISYDLPSQTYILRSVGKFFGLAGLRIGALYAEPTFCRLLMGLSALWNMSTLSLTIATHAVQDSQWIAETRLKLSHTMVRLTEVITSAGYKIIGKTDLYCLIGGDDMQDLFHHLAQNGIYARAYINYPYQMRLGLPPTEAAFNRIQKIFQDQAR